MSVVVTNLRKNNNKNTQLTAICFGVEFGAYLDTLDIVTNKSISISQYKHWNIDANN